MDFTNNIKENVKSIQDTFNNANELIVKEISINNIKGSVIYFKGLVDTQLLSEFVLVPCSIAKKVPKNNVLEHLKQSVIMLAEIEEGENILHVSQEITFGKACMFVENCSTALIFPLEKIKERAITEPPTSAVLKGPREGFNENIKTNLSCLRKIISSPHLMSYKLEIGTLTKTQVSVMYLDNVADDAIVKKIIDKIKLINIDGVIDAFYIAQHLEQRPKSIFKQVGLYEKPDIVASKLLEGRVAVLVDGSPIVLTLPFVLIEDLHSADDYYTQQFRVQTLRVIRIISIFLTILLPALYISMQLYHYRAIPLRFLVTILNSTQGLPFTPFSEIMVVIILFEILYEASLRMPKYLGLALSVVGALILGDTAVKAGLISPPTVMIVAVSGITIYTIPEQAAQLSMLRLAFTIVGGLIGFYGLVLVSMFIIIYLSDFDNYGAPYLAPFTPRIKNDKQDSVFKADILNKKTRPQSIPNKNIKRSR